MKKAKISVFSLVVMTVVGFTLLVAEFKLCRSGWNCRTCGRWRRMAAALFGHD